MRLVFLADTHGRHEELEPLPDGDILIHLGDFCTFGTAKEGLRFIKWFEKQPHPRKILVAGNHERFMDPSTKFYCAETKARVTENVIYLENSSVEIEGVNFFGWPWVTEEDAPWGFSSSERPLFKIPPDTDVLLTHCPPQAILDVGFTGRIGCWDILEEVLEKQPLLHVFGHCHNQRGVFKEEDIDTVFMNATNHGPYDTPLLEPCAITLGIGAKEKKKITIEKIDCKV